MKCCGSPTTSTVPDIATSVPGNASANRARDAAAQFDALLLGVAFKPLATALGFYGDLVVGSASQAVARVERGGLTDRLERLIDATASSGGSPLDDRFARLRSR